MRRSRRNILSLALLVMFSAAPAGARPTGTMTWAVHVTLATRWLDPAEADAEITPFMIFYALHDALVKPMPASLNAPSLAESWTMSKDGRVWEFMLRKGARFHNGDPVTGEDVKFSFERYRGTSNKMIKDRVAAVEAIDPARVRFRLKQPWPDFMTFYGTSASGAAWIVPKKYFEMDRKKREDVLHQIQRILHERVVFAPIWENGFIRAFGPRVEEAGLKLIPAFPYSAPLEDLRLKP
jgi:peptide/nickel transport system substrate-binding protein